VTAGRDGHIWDEKEGRIPVNSERIKGIVKTALPRIAVLYAILLLFPVEYRLTRLATVLGALVIWVAALLLWWRNKRLRVALAIPVALVLVLLVLPGRDARTSALRADYLTALKVYGHARYVWGGESPAGIDCSGLVRKGLVWGHILNGVQTVNGRSIRKGISLWWTDCSAKALRDGYRELTVPLFDAESVNETDPAGLAEGDLAVTRDGVHVMGYIGGRTWMAADPDLKKVVQLTVPADNPWFRVPVVLLRWRVLEEKETRTNPST